MKLIIGLGNHGATYDGTRHNTGFAMLDAFAAQHGLEWHAKSAFKATVAEGVVEGRKIVLVKPTTYYNLSGEAAQAIKHFYKLDNSDILAVHDELALPFGTIRARQDGSDAGNNGIKSLSAHLGPDFGRVRVGIAQTDYLGVDATAFVLGHFTHEERQQLPEIAGHVARLVTSFIRGEFEHTTLS